MSFIVRQNKELFTKSDLNIDFVAEAFELFSKQGNAEHLKSFFKQERWHQGSPVEIHPYLDRYPANFECKNLLIGTMPPISYLKHPDHPTLIKKRGVGNPPMLYHFYGNKGTCWDYFINHDSTLDDIKKFLSENSMTISDTVKVCQRKRNPKYQPNKDSSKAYTADDEDLYNILLNKEIGYQLVSPTCQVQNLYFTSGGMKNVNIDRLGSPNLRDGNFGAFSSFIAILFLMGISVDFAAYGENKEVWQLLHHDKQKLIQEKLSGKVVFKIRLNRTHEFNVICLPSPASQNPLGQIFFKKWLYCMDSRAYKKYSEYIYKFEDGRTVSGKAEIIKRLNRDYDFLPDYEGFTNPGDIYLRDVYQLALNPVGLSHLVGIQNQAI